MWILIGYCHSCRCRRSVSVHLKLSRGAGFSGLLLQLHILETNPSPVFNVLIQEKKIREKKVAKNKNKGY